MMSSANHKWNLLPDLPPTDGDRLVIAASGFMGGCYKHAILDVRVFNLTGDMDWATEIFTPSFCNASKALAQSVVMLARLSPLLQLILLQLKQTPPCKVQQADKLLSFSIIIFFRMVIFFYTSLCLAYVKYNFFSHSKILLFCLMGTIQDVS